MHTLSAVQTNRRLRQSIHVWDFQALTLSITDALIWLWFISRIATPRTRVMVQTVNMISLESPTSLTHLPRRRTNISALRSWGLIVSSSEWSSGYFGESSPSFIRNSRIILCSRQTEKVACRSRIHLRVDAVRIAICAKSAEIRVELWFRSVP